jgi:hypothetical protein
LAKSGIECGIGTAPGAVHIIAVTTESTLEPTAVTNIKRQDVFQQTGLTICASEVEAPVRLH